MALLLNEIHNKKILIAVLNWGLGHATRSLAINQVLQTQGNTIVWLADGLAYDYLKSNINQSTLHKLPDLNLKYKSNAFVSLLQNIPQILKQIRWEQKAMQALVETHQPDIIISDNRYGVYFKGVPTIIITHQLNPLLPNSLRFLQVFSKPVFAKLLNKFDVVWVPDHHQKQISGTLSKNQFVNNIQFVGWQSQLFFSGDVVPANKIKLLILLSGPEPARSVFEQKLLDCFAKMPHVSGILIRGTNANQLHSDQFEVYNLADKQTLKAAILSAENIICRSGYSTLMDLMLLNKKAILIPTPGQTEQIYLANQMQQIHGFQVVEESRISIEIPRLFPKS